MFSGGQRRDETSSRPSIHEGTLRSDHEKKSYIEGNGMK